MKKFLFSLGALCLLLTGCSKSPEKIVNEVYENAKQQQFGKIANLILPDSITPLTEEEQGRFEEMMKSAMGFAEYTEVAVDSVTVNPEGTEAKFVVTTKFSDGKSYTERGTLRKTASDRWRLLASKEANDSTEVFSVTNKDKHTTELMRNLDFAMSNFLSTRGIPQYQVIYADYLDGGIMTKADKKQAFELYENAANNSYVPAYRKVAWAYDNGEGVEKDAEKGFEWYGKAAEAGDTRVFFQLGKCYHLGKGTMKDYGKAIEWYKKGMEAKDPNAYTWMAIAYEEGSGVEKDVKKTTELIMEAYKLDLEQGASDEDLGLDESNIGRSYEVGKGVDKDINKAIEYFKKSAEHGCAYGMIDYADVYYYGTDGTPKDYDKAFYWYNKAYGKGNTYAMWKLAECYEYGRGTDKSKAKAKDMYNQIYEKTKDESAWRNYCRL